MLVKNGMTALPGESDFKKTDVRIEKGKIREIGSNLSGSADIDASGCYVLPGGIDPHVHFYDPGYTEKEDFEHGTAAAASGGITTIVDMPGTSNPQVVNKDNLNIKLSVVQPKAHIDFGFFGGVSRQLFESGYEEAMESIKDDVLAYKVYSVSGAEDVWGALDHFKFRKVLEQAASLKKIVLLHAEDAEYVNNAAAYFRKKGRDPEHWYQARPELAEILAVSAAVRITEEAGGNLHIVHVGTGEAAEIIGRARAGGLSRGVVTAETCPQYLAFGLEDFKQQGPALKISPPIKREENIPRLWKELADGTLQFVASDHAPGTPDEKAPGDIWNNSAGIAGTGTILPFMFSEGLLSKKISLRRYLEVMHENAARRYGLWDRKGSIETGKDGDLVLMHSQKSWTVFQKDFYSKGKLSPFEGRTFRSRVEKSLVRGTVVYDADSGICGEPGHGRLLKPNREMV